MSATTTVGGQRLDLDSIKSTLQRHFSDGLVTVVGSGLSCAEGLPSMGDLADHLLATINDGLDAADFDLWKTIGPAIKAVGLEAALLKHPPSPALETRIIARSAELVAAKERAVIDQVFSAGRRLKFSRLLPHMIKPEGGLAIITTNYDRLVEVAAEEAGLGVDTMFVGQFAGRLDPGESRLSFCREVTLRGKRVHWRFRERVNVCKPHGSLDWYHRKGAPVRYSGDLDSPRLIITPGLNKFRNGYESPFDRHRERANGAIDRASRFLAIGYGFNDDHLETHLTPRIRAGVPTLLLTYALSPNALKLAQECANVIAVQRSEQGGNEGSSIFINKSEVRVPDLALWDLDTFVSEVLEP